GLITDFGPGLRTRNLGRGPDGRLMNVVISARSRYLRRVIGVFDSGFGGLTVLSALIDRLPAYDYLYLGDSARAPYGGRSHEAVYQFTREAGGVPFHPGCPPRGLGGTTPPPPAPPPPHPRPPPP